MRYAKQVAEIAAAVRAGASRRVVAAGGMGKTQMLERVAEALEDIRVVRWSPAVDPDRLPLDGDVVLADDVHLARVETLRILVRRDGGVVAAHRPAGGVAEQLLDALDGAPMVLEPLSADDVHALLTARWGHEPQAEIVDEILAATGGSPRLVVAVAASGPITAVDSTAALEELVRSERQRLDPLERILLDAATVLAGLDLSVLAAAAELEMDDAATAAARLASAGLALDESLHLAPVINDVIRRLVPASEVAAVVERAATAALAAGQDIAGVAERIRVSGVAGPAAAQCLLFAARKALDDDPERARALVKAAARGDAVPGDLAALQALISFRLGALETTVTAVDDLLRADPQWRQGPLRREAVETAAVVLARRGAWARSAQLAEAVGPDGDNAVAIAATARLALGDADGVRNVVRRHDDAAPPGMRAAAAGALGHGLVASFADDPITALPTLLEAAQLYELSAPSVPLPEAPEALGAVVACHLWEFDVAAQVLGDVRARSVPGGGQREDLLRAWVALRRGDWVSALATVEQVRARGRITPRDAILAYAVQAGVARRRGDLETMAEAWRASRTLLLRQIPDLLLLQPVGELLITGARLGDRGTVRTSLASVTQVVTRAGHPPLWAQALLWDQMHIALALADADAAHEAAKAADALAAGGRAELVAAAAVCWVDALHGDADPQRVRAAARGLADIGLTWEGGRLAGAAAIRMSDREQMRDLLQFARELTTERTTPLTEDASDLSPRERDVAAHLLTGLTYREIGAQLFIAPKTVEHHVARIRRKLGAQSRAELLLTLRRHISTDEG